MSGRGQNAWPLGQWIAIAMFAALFGWLGWIVRTGDRIEMPGGAAVERVAPGEPAPALRLADLRTGVERDVLPPGRVRLLNYWASWCGPCRKEMPLLDRFAVDQGANGVEVVGIALDDPGDAKAFLDRVPVGFPMFREAPGPADSSAVLGNKRDVLPFSVLIGADGRVLKTKYGAFSTLGELESWARPD